jgi:hypothetical protein
MELPFKLETIPTNEKLRFLTVLFGDDGFVTETTGDLQGV